MFPCIFVSILSSHLGLRSTLIDGDVNDNNFSYGHHDSNNININLIVVVVDFIVEKKSFIF